MDRESLVQTPREAVALPRHHQSIEFERVIFHYSVADSKEQGRTALNDVSVTIPFGATVAVVGSNGSGKSTLINLLPRFYDPHSGSVRVDGIDLKTVDPRDVRCQMGIVTQETLLFDWSIARTSVREV